MKINSNLGMSKFQLSQLKNENQKDEFQEIMKNKIDKEKQTNDKLKEVSEEFESLFVSMMFKQMKDAGFKSKLLDSGLSRKIFEDMYYDELAKITAKESKLGIAEAIYQQLNQK